MKIIVGNERELGGRRLPSDKRKVPVAVEGAGIGEVRRSNSKSVYMGP